MKEGVMPFNLRPYHFSLVQKNVNIVSEMLYQGIIHHSNSPFAYPTILVRNKDESWQLCVNIRRLSELIIKECFPILLI